MTEGQKRREERRLAIIEKYKAGTPISELATAYGLQFAYVKKIATGGAPSRVPPTSEIIQLLQQGTPTVDVAIALNVSYRIVSSIARKHGIILSHKYSITKRGFSRKRKLPDSLDWSLNDADLATIHKCSKEWIRQIRKKLGKPKVDRNQSAFYLTRLKKRNELITQIKSLVQNGLIASEVCAELNVDRKTVVDLCRANGIRFQPQKRSPQWANTVDWGLPLKQIAERVGLSIPRIAQVKRALRLTKPHPIGYDWSQIDWSKTNNQIAQDIGCGIDAVQINRPYGKTSNETNNSKPEVDHRGSQQIQ